LLLLAQAKLQKYLNSNDLEGLGTYETLTFFEFSCELCENSWMYQTSFWKGLHFGSGTYQNDDNSVFWLFLSQNRC